MSMVHFNRHALLIASASVATVFLAVAALVFAAQFITLNINTPSVSWFYRLSLSVTIVGAVLFGVLFFALTYIGVVDRANRVQFSELYPPVMLKAGTLFAFFLLASVGAIDSLIHDLRPRWMVAMQPEIRIVYALLYAGVVSGFAWFLGKILQGRGFRAPVIVLAYACIAVAAAAAVLMAIALFE